MDIIRNYTIFSNADTCVWSMSTSEECTLEELVRYLESTVGKFHISEDVGMYHPSLYDVGKYTEYGEKLKNQKVELVKGSNSWGYKEYLVKVPQHE